jgi:Zn finger protein HypA/HybF involved in hydrogenase expression
MQVIERTEGHYDVQEVQFGTVYRWCPECVMVECDCGESPTLTRSESTCPECGADHAAIIREELFARRVADETIHPWHYAENRQEVGLPC